MTVLLDPRCPCGRAQPYIDCCGALHRGERKAATAEALMRSRYAAFSRGEVDYLIRTWHPEKRGALDRRSLEDTCRQLSWVELRILDTVAGTETDDTGIVEFEAHYRAGASAGVMHERSRFERIAGQWYYLDGITSDRPAPRRKR